MKQSQFRAFVDSERQRLVGYVRSLLTDAVELDAEDLVHDVLLRMLERADPTVPLENLGAYVYRALRNRVIDHVRTRRRTVSLDTAGEPGSATLKDLLHDLAPADVDVVQSERGRRQLFEALEHLSDIERNVVIAHEFEGRRFRELAQMWGVPQNTLLSHKARAIKKLKQHFLETVKGAQP